MNNDIHEQVSHYIFDRDQIIGYVVPGAFGDAIHLSNLLFKDKQEEEGYTLICSAHNVKFALQERGYNDYKVIAKSEVPCTNASVSNYSKYTGRHTKPLVGHQHTAQKRGSTGIIEIKEESPLYVAKSRDSHSPTPQSIDCTGDFTMMIIKEDLPNEDYGDVDSAQKNCSLPRQSFQDACETSTPEHRTEFDYDKEPVAKYVFCFEDTGAAFRALAFMRNRSRQPRCVASVVRQGSSVFLGVASPALIKPLFYRSEFALNVQDNELLKSKDLSKTYDALLDSVPKPCLETRPITWGALHDLLTTQVFPSTPWTHVTTARPVVAANMYINGQRY